MNQRERIAKAMYEAPDVGDDRQHVWPPSHSTDRAWWLSRAEAAQAVFEEANTPTDDEREALVQVVRRVIDAAYTFEGELDPAVDEILVRELLAAGFHRTVQGELSSEVTHRGTFGHVWPCPLFYVGNWKHIENGYTPERDCTNATVCTPPAPTVQGEPSDAHDLSQTRVVYWQDCNCDYRSKYCDENHTQSARIPLASLRAAAETGGER